MSSPLFPFSAGCVLIQRLRARSSDSVPPFFPGGGAKAVEWLRSRVIGHTPIRVPVYSDALFQSFLCCTMEIKKKWLQYDNVDRRYGVFVVTQGWECSGSRDKSSTRWQRYAMRCAIHLMSQHVSC